MKLLLLSALALLCLGNGGHVHNANRMKLKGTVIAREIVLPTLNIHPRAELLVMVTTQGDVVQIRYKYMQESAAIPRNMIDGKSKYQFNVRHATTAETKLCAIGNLAKTAAGAKLGKYEFAFTPGHDFKEMRAEAPCYLMDSGEFTQSEPVER